MPELAAFYLAGLTVSLIVGVLFGLKQRSRYHSIQYEQLQKNLRRINLRWNDLNLSVEELKSSELDLEKTSEQLQKEEYQKARISTILFVGFAAVLSWLGLIFLILIWVSLRVLGKSRTERNLFSSPLATSELDQKAVEDIYSNNGIKP